MKAWVMTLPAIIRTYLDAYNRKDVATLASCVADGVVFENVSNAGQSLKIEGRDAFARLATQAANLFVHRNQTVKTAVVNGDSVALEIAWTGTPAVDLGPMKAGVETTMRGASFMTIADGKLIRIVDLS
ncbi:nuclear transport factor 2 family protein [Gluconacetobacter takamatsuzukensis]|uniref:Nuclear transport factor 2 family protein n=1 Tax=Gluconacetobacter takamatsuzukensis TaxID=1286190 RepID=A0A7W4KDS7_9PROT|nr:nuclear transport factor 2 family protein [Gluconacetobacter takamatsuzukensis]MBB2205122.1 nuclear transport factor 2 family protein [Gluconacetobacter takamatsuzukensis]